MILFSLICQRTLETQQVHVCDDHALEMPLVQEGKVEIFHCDNDVECDICSEVSK